jgi:steroid 5-alpha reductase family enzyme
MANRKGNKGLGLIICLLGYVVAGFMVWLIYDAVSIIHPILVVLVLDILATIIIFLFSVAFNNSSMYDPYWSLVPPVILCYWVFHDQSWPALTLLQAMILILVTGWSLRLTVNWVLRWKGLRDEDWRYLAFRFKYQHNYWVVSFFGIHLFPTLVVFLGCLAVYPALVLHEGGMGPVEWFAAVVTLAGVVIETISDIQLSRYVNDKDKCDFLCSGLWKYSRHPNYFGEVLFWMGLFLFSSGTERLYWWIVPGPVIIILMFYTISIPMIDKRMLRRKTGYRDYLKRTSAMIPLKPKEKPASSINIIK